MSGLAEPLLELRGITRCYGGRTLALVDVDLTVEPGETVAVVGRSGSGKSTLLNILGLLDAPDDGQLLLGGELVEVESDRRRSERRRSDLGFVFQRAHLVPELTALGNVVLGLRYCGWPERTIVAQAEQALCDVGLRERINASARTLSGGEMQRVAIARTVARPARLWLADEPTGNLDSAQAAEIVELLKARAIEKGAALVVVTHEPDVAAALDRRVVLSDGRIVEDRRIAPLTQTGVVVGVRRSLTVPPPPAADAEVPMSYFGVRTGPTGDLVAARESGCEPSTAAPPMSASGLAQVAATARFISESLTAQPRRLWTSVIATALAVALTIAALGLSQSASSQVSGLFDAQRARTVTAEVVLPPDADTRWPIDLSALAAFPGVEGVTYWRQWSRIEMSNGAATTTEAQLVELHGDAFSGTRSEVRWAPGTDHRLGRDEVVLGGVLADRLGVTQTDLLPEVRIAGVNLRVVGIVTESQAAEAAGSAFVVSPLVEKGAETGTVFVQTVPGAARGVGDRLINLIDPWRIAKIRVAPVLSPDAYRDALEADVATSLQVLAVVASLAGLLAVVCLHVLSISARRSEFGVRRAFGARRSDLVRLVIGETSSVGVLGALVGMALGFAAVMGVTAASRWHPVFETRLMLVGLVGAVVFGILAGIAPAVAAGRIEPAEAVRS